jgi:hypothetical protein
MRRTTSTIKRVQDLLTTPRDRRFARQTGRFSAEDGAARREAERRQDSALAAGRPVPPMPGGRPGAGAP